MDISVRKIVCDNVVVRDNGRPMIVESMFSAVSDLSTDHGEILARIHPTKKWLFDELLAGLEIPVGMRAPDGRTVRMALHGNVQIHVNGPAGIVPLDYSVVSRSRSSATGEAHGRGFDENAEPLIRQMPDRSFRLVFCTLPPSANKLGDRFDMDHFGNALMKSCKAEMRWDDRDVFWISATATEADIRGVLAFIKTYGDTGSGRKLELL